MRALFWVVCISGWFYCLLLATSRTQNPSLFVFSFGWVLAFWAFWAIWAIWSGATFLFWLFGLFWLLGFLSYLVWGRLSLLVLGRLCRRHWVLCSLCRQHWVLCSLCRLFCVAFVDNTGPCVLCSLVACKSRGLV
jgi:hypothetical protein